MKKIFKRLALFFIIITLIYSTITYANTQENELEVIEKSKDFETWENLSEEEKANTIQPALNNVSIKDSIKRSTYNTLLGASSTLENKYNLKDKINSILVKNQQKTGACWAFSFTSVLETTISNKYKKTSQEYSPIHIGYKTSQMYNKKPGDGGNMWLALAYSTSGYGPVYESDLPFNSVYNEETNSAEQYYLNDISSVSLDKTVRAKIEDATVFASICKSYSADSITYKDSTSLVGYNKYSKEEVEVIRNLIKQQIKEDGAVMATFYSDMGVNAADEYVSTGGYYNPTTKAFYCDKALATVNHAVTIVGWDDTYSKENFAEGHKPLNDGAYIVLNSWGTEFGDNGYFYVSYDDVTIEQQIYGIDSVKEYDETSESASDYDYIYQYDELGMSAPIKFANDAGTAYLSSLYAANVFTKNDNNKTEYLTEVGLFLGTTQGIEVYVNPSSEDFSKAKLVASYTGSKALESGYRTVKLAAPVRITGSKFSVIVKYINSEGAELPIECNLTQSGITSETNYYDTATSNAGESYFSKDGQTWNDMYNYVLSSEYTLRNTNACIKAFTSETISVPERIFVTGVKLNKNVETLNEGDTTTLIATVLPENVTNKNVTWSSSNEDVATITDNGIITAKKEGKTTITVTTEEGNFSNKCDLTVTKKTNTDDDIYKEDDNNLDNGLTNGINQGADPTEANKKLPYAGSKIIIIAISGIMIVSIILYKKYRSYDDVK